MTDAIIEPLLEFGLVLVRASGLVVFCPIFNSRQLPRRFRALLALAISAVLFPLAPIVLNMDGTVTSWVLLLLRELVAGLGLGLAARVIFDGVEGAARLVAGQSGFALASMIDPFTGGQSAPPALFQSLLATTLILAADLHHLFIRGLITSYGLLPPAATLPSVDGMQASVAAMGTRLFSIAVQLAGPALVITFAVDLVLVLMGRALPQFPVLMVGYPLKVAAGLIAMGVLASITAVAIRWVGTMFVSDATALLAALGAA
ncbi:MAG: flagellar biosynthetic protein FliR [bacterium]|nr:flagellar biosynthetic protein FliR [bacterium]